MIDQVHTWSRGTTTGEIKAGEPGGRTILLKGQVEAAARTHPTNQAAADAMNVRLADYLDLCRGYDVETPSERRQRPR